MLRNVIFTVNKLIAKYFPHKESKISLETIYKIMNAWPVTHSDGKVR